jgi:UTP--glucose-1-phosphate uridylyltransferase
MKAVIPAAGLGTRLLPASKSMPKEMLPVVDKPVIQYVVEEAVASGCEEILLITGRGKRAIEDHFDKSFELEHHLEQDGKTERLDRVQEISDLAKIHYVRQPEPKGLGDAVLHARQFVDDEPFAVLLGDNIIYDGMPATQQLVDLHDRTGASCFSVMRVPEDEISKYGAVEGQTMPVEGHEGGTVFDVDDIIEKPTVEEAPSTIATMGRYVFEPEILDALEEVPPGHGGELQLTDAMARIARTGEINAKLFTGTRLDVGNVEGFLEANLVLGLRNGKIGPEEVKEILSTEPSSTETTEAQR